MKKHLKPCARANPRSGNRCTRKWALIPVKLCSINREKSLQQDILVTRFSFCYRYITHLKLATRSRQVQHRKLLYIEQRKCNAHDSRSQLCIHTSTKWGPSPFSRQRPETSIVKQMSYYSCCHKLSTNLPAELRTF